MKRTNFAIVVLVAVIIVACATYIYSTQDDVTPPADEPSDDGPVDDGGRLDYELVPITDEMREWMPAAEARTLMDDSLDAYLETSMTEGVEIGSALKDLEADMESIGMSYFLMTWDYNRDPSTLTDEYLEYSGIVIDLQELWEDALRQSLQGPNSDAVREAIGDAEADRLLDTEPSPPELIELLNREKELAAQCRTSTDGETAAEFFLDLVDVRNSIANYYGYESYPEYAYAEMYGRDYTPDEAVALIEMANKHLEPLGYLITMDVDEYYATYSYTDQEELFEKVKPFIDSVCPEFTEIYDYMREYGLIDFEDLDSKADVGYTQRYQYLTYIFDKPTMDAYDIHVLVHEFGHAASLTQNEYTTAIDICEIQSQGLECLLALDPGMVFDTDESMELYEQYTLNTMLSSIISGLAVNSFEISAYSGLADSDEELQALWYQSFAECGFINGSEWWQVIHLYDGPLYYISYAVSAFNALEIFVDGLDDHDAAVNEYLDVVTWTGDEYNQMTESLGMMNIFDPEDFETVIGALTGYLVA